MNIRSHVAAITDIDGIAQRTADKLAIEGITTLQQVRDLTEEEIDQLDVKLALRGQPRLLRWREQAAELLVDRGVQEEEIVESTSTAASPPAPDREAVMAQLASQLAALQDAETKVKVPKKKSSADKWMRLNPNRDFGDVYGTDKDGEGRTTGATFSQLRNGREVYFNQEKVEIRHGEISPDPMSDEVEEKHEATDFNDFHAINYLDGKVDYPFEFVRRAIQSRFGRAVKTERHAKAMLHEQLRQNH